MKDVIFCEKELKNNRIIIHKYDTKEQLDGIKNKGEYYYTRVGTMVVVRDVAKDKLVDASTLYDIRGLRLYLEYEGDIVALEKLVDKSFEDLLDSVTTKGGEALYSLLDDISIILDMAGLYSKKRA